MKTVPHPQQTHALGAPPGWDHSKVHCGSLSIQDDVSSGYPVMKSRWEAEGFEALAMALGAAQIELGVFSEVHPPVSLIAYPVSGWTADRGRMAMAYEKTLRNLIEHAEANGFKVETVNGRVQFADAADQVAAQ
jgi:hypothetical protein